MFEPFLFVNIVFICFEFTSLLNGVLPIAFLFISERCN